MRQLPPSPPQRCPPPPHVTSLSVRESTSIILVCIGTKVRGSKVRLPRLLKLYCGVRKETEVLTPLYHKAPRCSCQAWQAQWTKLRPQPTVSWDGKGVGGVWAQGLPWFRFSRLCWGIIPQITCSVVKYVASLDPGRPELTGVLTVSDGDQPGRPSTLVSVPGRSLGGRRAATFEDYDFRMEAESRPLHGSLSPPPVQSP